MKIFSDIHLIRRFQAGDKEAFGEIFEKYYDNVFDYLYRAVRCPATAEDLTQKTFIKLFTQLENEKGKTRESAGPLIITIMQSMPREHQRQKRHDEDIVKELSISPEIYARPSDADYENGVLRAALKRALVRLRPRLRQAAELFHIGGLTYDQIAKRLGISRAATYERVRRATKMLAEELADYKERRIEP